MQDENENVTLDRGGSGESSATVREGSGGGVSVKFLPYERYAIETCAAVADVVNILKPHVEPRKELGWFRWFEKYDKFVGEVTMNHFSLRLFPTYGTLKPWIGYPVYQFFWPMVYGSYTEGPRGTIVRVRCMYNPIVSGLYAVVSVLIVLRMGFALVTGTSGLASFPLLLIAILLFAMLRFWTQAGRAKKRLHDALRPIEISATNVASNLMKSGKKGPEASLEAFYKAVDEQCPDSANYFVTESTRELLQERGTRQEGDIFKAERRLVIDHQDVGHLEAHLFYRTWRTSYVGEKGGWPRVARLVNEQGVWRVDLLESRRLTSAIGMGKNKDGMYSGVKRWWEELQTNE